MRVGLVASSYLAVIGLVRGVHMAVFLAIGAVSEPSIATIELTFEWLLTSVGSFVNLEILASSKHFPATREGARERLFSCVNANVIDQLVLGLERLAFPGAVLPEACMVALLRSSNVFYRYVRDYFVH